MLHQSLLTKYLFSHAEHSLSDFIFDIHERKAFYLENGEVAFAAHFEAVCEISRKWFVDLLTLED